MKIILNFAFTARSLQDMLTYDPAQRISAKQLLKNPYFDDVDRKKLPAGNYDGTLVLPPRHF